MNNWLTGPLLVLVSFILCKLVHELCLSGVVPSCILEASKTTGGTETPSPAGGAMFSKRTGLSVYRSVRRQRRRSVGGEIVIMNINMWYHP